MNKLPNNSAIAILACMPLFALQTVSAQVQESGFLNRAITIEGISHKYQVYVPPSYQSSSRWPVILFLHGAGERGDDGLKQAETGLGNAIRKNPTSWPTIAVFPQVPTGESWLGIASEVAIAALDATIAEFSIDESRQYLTGLSLGGNGTWYLGYQHTERFAALVPICGFVDLGDPFPSFLPQSSSATFADLAKDIAAVPTWIFHGDADVVVPVEQSRRMASELEAIAALVHYTEFPGINHNSWDLAYEHEEMVEWLFKQQKSGR